MGGQDRQNSVLSEALLSVGKLWVTGVHLLVERIPALNHREPPLSFGVACLFKGVFQVLGAQIWSHEEKKPRKRVAFLFFD
jgi:hypothetical protein